MPGDFKLDLAAAPGLRHSRVGLGLAAIWLAMFGASAAEPPSPPEFRRLPPLPSVQQAATAARIPLTGLDQAVGRENQQVGDRVVALVSVIEGRSLEQRLVMLEAAARVAPGKKEPFRQVRLYSSSGYEFIFSSEPADIEISLVGPLQARDAGRKAATAPVVQRRRVSVAGDFLSLGLERIPAVALRVHAAREADPSLPAGSLNIAPTPFPPETTGPARAVTEAVGIVQADERALAGSVLALIEFFQIATRTPGLQEVLKSVLDLPWWSILRSGGKMPDIYFEALPGHRELAAVDWQLPAEAKVYSYPLLLRLNGEPALLFQLAVVAPRPPLRVSAGIVGLAAGRPDAKGPVLSLQIVAARAAGGKPQP